MLVPAYAATIHKSQGSEYPAVIIPVLTQHYAMAVLTIWQTTQRFRSTLCEDSRRRWSPCWDTIWTRPSKLVDSMGLFGTGRAPSRGGWKSIT
jgi:hypothetical protein